MTVKAKFDGFWLTDFLVALHPHIDLRLWDERAASGRLELDGRKLCNLQRRVRAGNRLVHTIPFEIEPEVATHVRFIFEDEDLVVLHKPAPLPMHPCGRFNRNSLVPLLQHAFNEVFRPVHRLDADTTGLVVLAKSQAAARSLTQQFEARTVSKVYLAQVVGVPTTTPIHCRLPLHVGPQVEGKRQVASANRGQAAETTFHLLATQGNESLVSAEPSSGRTNQIRVHLAALGLPIVGDAAYSGPDAFTSGRTTLHLQAWQLAFCHPRTNAPMQFQDEWPTWAVKL